MVSPWKCVGKSVKGASHVTKNKPCQDSFLCKEIGDSAIVAIADGHGSAKSPFSDEGAQIAVVVAMELLEQLHDNYFSVAQNLSEIKHYSEEQLKKLIIRNWKDRVKEAYSIRLGNNSMEENFYVKYGTTLIAVLATPEFILFLQLGDGDILVVFETGEIAFAIEKDEELVGVETTSLCSKDAWKHVKTQLYKLDKENNSVKFIMASTDGYFNSFANDEGYKKTAIDYMNLIKVHGNKKVQDKLEEWLGEVSLEGCGDDITLAFIAKPRLYNTGRKAIAEEQLMLAMELYNSKQYKIKEIVEKTGISKSTLYKYIKERI